MQLQRQYQHQLQQQKNDARKLQELQALQEELKSQDEENKNFKNYRDVRPSALAKAEIKKQQQREELEKAAQGQKFTNQAIAEKINGGQKKRP